MATAVKTTPETVTRSPQQRLVLNSLLGALYVFFSFALVFVGLPMLWDVLDLAGVFGNVMLADALLILVTLPTIVGLILLGLALEGPHPQPGQRAGACIGAFLLFLGMLLTLGIANNYFQASDVGVGVGLVLTLALAGGLLFLLVWTYAKPGFGRWLVHVEEAGWFHAITFKGNQGLRVRRGTLIGLLILGACGLYTMHTHRLLSAGDWEVNLPFSRELFDGRLVVPVLFHVNWTLPLVLAVGLLWFSWRVVNWPAFADFLIATEAEMNKVSWTTRKRLIQDTAVVLVTVFLMTIFLFVVDLLWIKILSNPVVDVLKIDPHEEMQKKNQGAPW
jgi:preprotein translocase SecE subunit